MVGMGQITKTDLCVSKKMFFMMSTTQDVFVFALQDANYLLKSAFAFAFALQDFNFF